MCAHTSVICVQYLRTRGADPGKWALIGRHSNLCLHERVVYVCTWECECVRMRQYYNLCAISPHESRTHESSACMGVFEGSTRVIASDR